MKHFITSRKAKIESIIIYKYNFKEILLTNKVRKHKFCNWLKYSNFVYDIKTTSFFLFNELDKKTTLQYELIQTTTITIPFSNTTRISNFIGSLIRDLYQKKYSQFFNENIFIVQSIQISYFKLLKCFKFNIEIFDDGEIFIHFIPISKIISSSTVSIDFLKSLKNSAYINPNTDNMVFNLIDYDNFKKKKVDLLSKDFLEEGSTFIEDREKVCATFNYHFIAKYSKDAFAEISKSTLKEIHESLNFLIPISKYLDSLELIKMHKKPFYEIILKSQSEPNNLTIGNNILVKEQKAAYYNGIYKPVNDIIVLPISIGNIETNTFQNLLNKFNGKGLLTILEPLQISPNEDINIEILKNLKNTYNKNLFISFLSEFKFSTEYLEPVKQLKIRFQIYQGRIDIYKLSNYVVKCLEKMGGLLSCIENTFEPETTYFIGIDMGHTINKEESYSNLSAVLFTHRGVFLSQKVIKKIPRNEVINHKALSNIILSFKNYLKKRKLPSPSKIIFHRDGKVHSSDIETIKTIVNEQLNVQNFDILEIIKSGFPIIASYEKKYFTPPSGSYWSINEKKYAILITNTQSKERNLVLSPIIIKHKYGSTKFEILVEQVYWFTKIYTNNLYNSTRLPATTERANNIAGTSNKNYVSTYLA